MIKLTMFNKIMLLITLFISMPFAAGNARFNFGYFHINSVTNIKSQQQHAGISPVQNQEARITDTMLNYPNPFRLSEGSEIRYTLNTATNVTLYIYHFHGYHIYKESFQSGQNGGLNRENTITINTGTIGTVLPAGIYYAILINDETGNRLGKTKLAVIP